MNADIGIIGGTGLYNADMLENIKEYTINTVYGDAVVLVGCFAGKSIAFLPRHGKKHTVPPHLINYRANITALQEIGVKHIIATASVGSLNMNMKPGDFVIIDQFIDFTKFRPLTFYDGGENGVVHTDMTEPYCPRLRKILIDLSADIDTDVHPKGVYVCTEGPRFETPAEIKMFQKLGGDVVGMTNVPEVVLAREKGICYAAVAVVTNYAAGISSAPLTHEEVVQAMNRNLNIVRDLIFKAAEKIFNSHYNDNSCGCRSIPGPVSN
ncbi:MAG TPA: S-methyl-5'-thioadenosine phosphorylase [Peptococcaceae bacterium]|nr:MAG: putative 6-oxopurine nucleoside phosphorylase [Clostridia bacterium 41_269]HBT20021.1 S-methyl-5'-thioadenosine phosphorylase [Peptococcaceae bacterium]